MRLSAEMIRDQALAVSGLLVNELGGPSVKPYQPEGLWEQLSAFPGRKLFVRSTGEDLWRRSVYTYWKRTVPPPSMTRVIAVLEQRSLVMRAAHATDKRQVMLTVTDEGRDLVHQSRRLRDAWLARRLRELTPAERAKLRAAAPILEKLSQSS